MFIFIGGDPNRLSPAEQQANMQKWFAWVAKLTQANRYVSGEALIPSGKIISGTKKVVTDGPFAESKELVGGFFVIQAKDMNEAIEMAKECPDYELGCSVQVRECMKFDK